MINLYLNDNNAQDNNLNSSDFYWEDLGIPNYSITKVQVSKRVDDFRRFISKAISRLKKISYSYAFISYTRITMNTKDLENLPEHIILCLDREFSKEVFNGKLAHGQKQLKIRDIHNISSLYIKGTNRVVRIINSSIILGNIQTKNVREEEENVALDALFEARDVYCEKRSKKNKLLILHKNRNKLELEIEKPDIDIKIVEPLIVAYNTYNLSVQENALKRLIDEPNIHMIPLINLLQLSKFVKWESFKDEPPQQYGVLRERTSLGTKEQREFVNIALGTSDFAILEGPPGSGKTSTLLEIILNLCTTDKKVLMVASTHVAVDNILERLSESKDGSGRLMDKFGVIPLRIGDEESVSNKVKSFTVSKRITSEKGRIKRFLSSQQSLTEAQRTLLSALDGEDNNVIEQLVIDSSNFICGTTIGILKSKMIKSNKRSGIDCPFDYMIIDEASKTTFTEFLVPALYAKRWIISGDPKQLSPYVDQEFIENIVSTLPSFGKMTPDDVKNAKDISIDVFNSIDTNSSHKLRGALVIGGEKDIITKNYVLQADKLSSFIEKTGKVLLPHFNLKDADSSSGKFKLLGSRLVIGNKELVDKYWKLVPPGLAIRGEVPTNLKRRRAAILDSVDIEQDSENWEYQISWRLNRAYELRNDPKSKKYLDELELLTLYFLDEDDEEQKPTLSKRIARDIRKIRKTFYPSIIEMLQYGVSDNKNNNNNTDKSIALYDGLPQRVFDRRHMLLTYQHRMHPDISKYARSYFYEERALQDAPDLREKRNWGYETHYRRKMIWIDRKINMRNKPEHTGTNINALEVEIIREELNSFMSWAKGNRKIDNEPWKVAVLTFYRGQEKELSKMMQKLTGLENYRRYFNLSSQNIDIEVCTVDRFQGQEADLVFLSMVRRRGVGFLDNMNRMNVALTRAKYQTVIVGDKHPFRNCKIEFLNRMVNEMEGPI